MVNKKEAARILGVSTRTLDRMIASGKIKAVQYAPRGKVFLDPEAVERCMRTHVKKAPVLSDKPMETSIPTTQRSSEGTRANKLVAFLADRAA